MAERFLFPVFFCCFGLLASSAFGAPFCVEAQGLPSECLYYDAQSCRAEAAKKDGYCAANPEELVLPDHAAPFCLVDTGMAPDCAFQSGEACHDEAAKRNAVCFQNTDSGGSDDPYKFDRLPSRYH